MAEQRQYWVVSPNVKNTQNTVPDWKEEILRAGVAVMGWAPTDNYLGRKFAGNTDRSVQRGDIILIARRYQHGPDMVGFGMVNGPSRRVRLPPHNDHVYVRDLEPFIRLSRVPTGVSLIDALPRNRALVQLHPEKKDDHRAVCEWMERRLRTGDREEGDDGTASRTTEARTSDITESDLEEATFDYEVKTKRQVILARKVEAGLVWDYKRWLEKRGRKLTRLSFYKLQCDAWEEESKNLVEAKGSMSREDIRMAAGQLLDYAFQMRKKFKDPHLAILLPDKPNSDSVKWLEPLGINVIWRSGPSFLDNANGQFTIE